MPHYAMPLKPRDLIVDEFEREGIVFERTRPPSRKWISDQSDRRVRDLPDDTIWWHVLVVRGGSVILAEPLTTFVREATIEDAMRAVEYANEHVRRTIGQLFPEAVERAMQRRQKGDHVA
jgi:hypothetical protein